MFGGSADPATGSDEKQSTLADTTLLQFRKYMNILIHDSTCVMLLSSDNWSCLLCDNEFVFCCP